ncbi:MULTISPECIES: DUF3408 domain-containing protein [Prevotellaceae]|uniref:DUF3408 domain-containing protein n=1 Tax=Prevotellaceae TaxID=171552 RepID=UPI0003D34EFB|nr:DUF3408 domain-containing protein [Prevotella phocaeensis]ETD18544.1 hypothetical protein HMPREF1199_01362 [Hoylesella oralis CC98A]
MSKKFKNIGNDKEFKNFKLEDYLPSMNCRKPEKESSESRQDSTMEAARPFPTLDEPDTSAVQETVPPALPQEQETWVASRNEMKESVTEADNVTVERTVARRISSKQHRLSLDEYHTTYLQVPKITDRKPVFVNDEVRDWLDEIVRRLGERGMSVSGLIENLVRLHIEAYREDIELWRKL